MKTFFTIIVSLTIFLTSYSQESPYFRQYIFDLTLLNPATGVKYKYSTIKLTGADKWINLPQNPQYSTLSANFQLPSKKMGFNTTIMANIYGDIQYTGLKASYFYYSKLNIKGDYISFGIYGSVFNYSFNLTGIDDPAITPQIYNTIYPNLGLGIFYHKEKLLNAGLSLSNLLPYKPQFTNRQVEPQKPQTAFMYVETKWTNIRGTVSFEPSLLFFFDKNWKKELHVNTRLIFFDKYWTAFSYRDALDLNAFSTHNICLFAGIQLLKKIQIAYSYEFDILNTHSLFGSTHSIMIAYIISRKKNIPMYF